VDGTAWMVQFSKQLLRIASELATHNHRYEEFATRFFEHTLRIAATMDRLGFRPSILISQCVNTEIFRIILPAAVHLVYIDDREH
jgi:hypothetical protein